jgi:hypothetical protein
VWENLPDVGARAVVTLEQYHDGFASESEFLDATNHLAEDFIETVSLTGDPGTPRFGGLSAVYAVISQDVALGFSRCIDWVQTTTSRAAPDGEKQAALNQIRRQICDLIREIIGNPFRPWKAIPDSYGGGLVQPDGRTVRLTDTARRLAEGIRAEQAFDQLPILADALEEAGVTDAEILEHLRREGGHVRGCWALDVVLGK